jgi:hypothetical protein
MNAEIHSTLSSALGKSKWTASSTSSFSHRKREPGNHEVGSGAGLGQELNNSSVFQVNGSVHHKQCVLSPT